MQEKLETTPAQSSPGTAPHALAGRSSSSPESDSVQTSPSTAPIYYQHNYQYGQGPHDPLRASYNDRQDPQTHTDSPENGQHSTNPPKRRKRKALSCFDCRRRKLRCDRELPCSRCRQEGHPETCVFESSKANVKADGTSYRQDSPSHWDTTSTALIDSNRLSVQASRSQDFRGPRHSHNPPAERANAQLKRHTDHDTDAKLVAQERRIAYLEDRLAHFETAQHLVELERLGQATLSNHALAPTSGTTPPRAPLNSTSQLSTSMARDHPDIHPGPIRNVAYLDHTARFRTHVEGDLPKAWEPIRYKGDDFETQFWGPTNPISTVYHFPAISPFVREAYDACNSLKRVQGDMKALKIRHKAASINISISADTELANLLPQREVVDTLVQTYFATFETTYRILHVPSFWSEYASYWADPANARPGFIVILLGVMATVNCMVTQEPWKYVGESSSARFTAKQWLMAAEAWVERQSHKHVTLALVQARCLILLAKQVNEIDKKILWTLAQDLLSFALSLGLHRDPRRLRGKCSLFNQEMRRRLWHTIVELELYISMLRGVAASSARLLGDCQPALHINDEELHETAEHLPTSRPYDEYTSTSFLNASQRSLNLRLQLSAALNDTVNQMRYEDMLLYDEKLILQLRELPKWATQCNEPTTINDQHVQSQSNGTNGANNFTSSSQTSTSAAQYHDTACVLLNTQLQHYLTLLHGPVAKRAETHPRFNHSRVSVMHAATHILEQHQRLMAQGNTALSLLRHDIYHASLYICHNYYLSVTLRQDALSPAFEPKQPIRTLILDIALPLLEDRVMRLGTGYNHYWHLSSAYDIVLAQRNIATLRSHQQQAIDRVSRLYYKALASQEDPWTVFPYLVAKRPEHIVPLSNAPFEPFDPLDLSGWTLDNLWNFDPVRS